MNKIHEYNKIRERERLNTWEIRNMIAEIFTFQCMDSLDAKFKLFVLLFFFHENFPEDIITHLQLRTYDT